MISTFYNFLSRNAIILLLLFCLIVGGYLSFLYWFYWGELRVYLSHFPAEIRIEGKTEVFTCADTFCTYRLVPGDHRLEILSEGFEPVLINTSLEWKESKELTVLFTEKKLQMHQQYKQTSSGTPEVVSFPLPKNISYIDSSLSNFEVRDLEVYWRNARLLSFSSPVSIVSDEVGRGVWIVSENEIKFFEKSTQSLSTVEKKNISSFLPLQDGGFILRDILDTAWVYTNNAMKRLPFELYSLELFCTSGKNFLFLDPGYGTPVLQKFSSDTQQISEIAGVENLNISMVSGLSCSQDSTVKIFLSSGNILTVGY